MDDLISRQAAIEAIGKFSDEMYRTVEMGATFPTRAWFDGMTQAECIVKNLPSAQPEIVRCKNCKHWMPYDWMFSEVWRSKDIDDYSEDEIGCAYCDMNMGANDFCSRVERRANDLQ